MTLRKSQGCIGNEGIFSYMGVIQGSSFPYSLLTASNLIISESCRNHFADALRGMIEMAVRHAKPST